MSILARLIIFALLAIIPAIAAHVINEILLYRDREQEIRQTVLMNAQARNTEMDGIIGGIRHLLVGVSQLASVSSLDQSSCNEQLESLTKEYPDEVALSVVDPKGTVVCSSLPGHLGLSVSNYAIFRNVSDTGEFRIGEYQVSPTANAKAISFGYPIRGEAGTAKGAVIAYLDLDWLKSNLLRAPFVAGQRLTITDRNGVVLAQAPAGMLGPGQRLTPPLLQLIGAASPGVAEVRDMQGRSVLYGYVPITVPPANIYVLYAIDENIAFGPIYLASWRSAVLSLVSVLATLVIAWVVGVKYIRRPIRQLLDAAQAWQRGNYSRRVDLKGPSSEILDLGRAFDDMAEKLQLHEVQLASANRIKDIILAAAGHDLRQPLQVITMAIIGLARRQLTDRERQYVERADKAVEQLADGLDELIEASRVRFGMACPRRQPVALDRVLQQITEQCSTRAADKGLRYRVFRGGNVVVESDPSMLSTILRNLVGNAIKYTDRGGILIGYRRRSGEVWIEVYDSGIGIPDDRIETIFGELQQLDRQREGLGLGLWIARTTAEALGHSLSVCSLVGQGSRFRIVVPLAPTDIAL